MKTIKWLLIIIGVIVLAISFIVMDPFSQRPFKFEDIDTIAEGQAFLEHRYPLSSDLSYVLEDLKKAGAECVERKLKDHESEKKEKGYEKAIRCVYKTGWVSKSPITNFIVVIYLSKDKIREIYFNTAYAFL